MNVCFLCGDLSRGGGTERIAGIISGELAQKEEYKIYLVDVANGSSRNYFKFDRKVEIEHLSNFKKFNILRKILSLYRFLKRHKIDVLVNVDVMLFIYSFIPAKLLGVKIISWEQFNYYNDIGSRHTQKIRQLCLKYTDYYINLTNQDMDTFKENFKVKIPITYIYNPVVSHKTPQYQERSKLLLTAGNFYKSKGYDYCVRIGENVFKQHPDWKWVFCGDGEEFNEIKAQVAKLEYSENFVFMGRVENLDEIMKQAAIYVSCSLSEGFGLVLLEAQQNSLPVVAFDVPFGPSEIILDNINGFLVKVYDERMMSEKICKLIEDENLRSYFASNSHKQFDKFQVSTIINQWEQVLKYVMK